MSNNIPEIITDRDYPEDKYAELKMCISCENDFFGNGGRMLCKECLTAIREGR